MEMKNFQKQRENGQRKYTADLFVNGEKYNLFIAEQYLTRGVKYKVRIKSKESVGLIREIWQKRKLPNLTEEEWYHLYFHYSNQEK